jgi:5-formyltetrahydrofolate cyclo-ligase
VTLVSSEPVVPGRRELRERLHATRDRFVADAVSAAHSALAARLGEVLAELMPDGLGLYWPLRSEFNAAVACLADKRLESTPLALPYVKKTPREMHYRAWDRREPGARDECGIPATEGAPVVPDVVLVPCLGFTASGYRLGYGGGYFDRWLAGHPHVTAVGVAWSGCEIGEAELRPEPHDQRLMLIVTEQGVLG